MTLLVKSSKRGPRLYNDLKVLNFFCGVLCFTFVRTFRSTKQLCWESYSWFFLTFYCTLKTVNFWLFLLPHDWAWQMKHWRKCLYPRAPELANCAAVLEFLHKIRPCTADSWRYPSFRTRLLDCLSNSIERKKYQYALLFTEGLELFNVIRFFVAKTAISAKASINK